jgi:T-complex protein 1 subunit zeta
MSGRWSRLLDVLHDARMLERTNMVIPSYEQDDVTGDGTTSTVLLCGELLRQTERYASEGLHPRVLVDGLEIARDATLEFLSSFIVAKPDALTDIDLLTSVARTSLQTKLDFDLAAILTQAVVSAITCVAEDANQPIDLNHDHGTQIGQ